MGAAAEQDGRGGGASPCRDSRADGANVWDAGKGPNGWELIGKRAQSKWN
jgi:hypothetical protein